MRLVKYENDPLAIAAAKLLKQKRLELGLTHREMGTKLNVAFSHISKIETLNKRLDLADFNALCKALGLNPIDALGEALNG